MRTSLVATLVAFTLAGCAGPGKRVNVQDVMIYAPASVTSNEAALQVCVVAARRYDTLDDAPDGKTLLVVPLTRTDHVAGAPSYAGVLGYPITFATRAPWFLTLQDGFLKVDVDQAKREVKATVEGAKGGTPPALSNPEELWVWIGAEPTKEDPDPRGTFVGVRIAK